MRMALRSPCKRRMFVGTAMRIVAVLAALGCISLAALSCQGSTKSPKTLVLAAKHDWMAVDMQQIDVDSIGHELLMAKALEFSLDGKKLYPSYLESWKVSDDGKTITFKLPANAKFSNGDILDAEAVKASFLRFKELSPMNAELEEMSDFEIPDSRTLIIKCKEASANLLTNFSSTMYGPVDVKFANTMTKEENRRNMVSNGLFKLDAWEQGSQIVMSKNPYYKTFSPVVDNKGPAKIDKVIIRNISSGFTGTAELQSGDVDILLSVPSADLDAVKNDKNITMLSAMTTNMALLQFNTQKGPLADIEVRRALAMAINKEELSKTVSGTLVPGAALLTPAIACYDAATDKKLAESQIYDPEKAKALLAERGWKDANGDGILEKNGKPFKITMIVQTSEGYVPMIQSQLRAIGVDASLQQFEWGYVYERMRSGNFDIIVDYYGWSDPNILNYVFGRKQYMLWGNAEIDKALIEARRIMNLEERTKAYSKIQMDIMEEMPVLPLGYMINYVAYKNSVSGIKFSSTGGLLFNDVNKK